VAIPLEESAVSWFSFDLRCVILGRSLAGTFGGLIGRINVDSKSA
jgi:hypothetical protein